MIWAMEKLKYTFGALLAQANSHSIHPNAIVSYILNGLGVEIINLSIVYNDITPKKI